MKPVARDGPGPNHTFVGNKNTAAACAETQTPETATPQPIRSYIPPPAELERPGSYTKPTGPRGIRRQNEWKTQTRTTHRCLPAGDRSRRV